MNKLATDIDKTLVYVQMLTLQNVRMAALKTAEGYGTSNIANAFIKLCDCLGHEIAELKQKIDEFEKGAKS